jgi:hypothetical protein
MSDDYLWDRSGAPDPEIEHLEGLLGTLGHRRRGLAIPSGAWGNPALRQSAWRRYTVPLALAAAIMLLVGGTWVALRHPAGRSLSPGPGSGRWTVERLEGTPTINARPVGGEARVGADAWLETDGASSARLVASDVGRVEIGPGTRVRLISARPGEHRLALAHGILHALIWASPGQFYVETPSATAIDLGCAYTLEVDASGTGVLRVTSGWVGFERHDIESLVPAGALCTTRPERGPGTPHFEDVAPRFGDAISAIDSGTPDAQRRALDVVLAAARPRDALTLWHLLTRLDRRSAERVYDRLATLAPPPSSVHRAGVLAGDRAALDAWWDTFGLGDATLFRRYRAR